MGFVNTYSTPHSSGGKNCNYVVELRSRGFLSFFAVVHCRMSLFSCFVPKSKDWPKTNVDEEKANGPSADLSPLSNGGRANGGASLEEVSSAYNVEPTSSGFDSAIESELPPPTAMAQITKPKPKVAYSGKKTDPGMRFVNDLPKHPEYRLTDFAHATLTWRDKLPASFYAAGHISLESLDTIRSKSQRTFTCRRQLVELVKAATEDEGLPSHLVAYINDNGYSLPSLASLNDVSFSCRTARRPWAHSVIGAQLLHPAFWSLG